MFNTGLSIAGSLGRGNQTCSNALVLFSMYTLEILGQGNQPYGERNPCAPHPLNKNPCITQTSSSGYTHIHYNQVNEHEHTIHTCDHKLMFNVVYYTSSKVPMALPSL